MCVPEKNPYNPIRTMYSCETLDCLGVHVCSDIDTEARSERALINVKKSPIFKTSDACRRVMLLLLLLLRERVGERVLPRRISPRSMPPPRHHTHTHTHLRIYGYMHVHALPLFIVVYMYVYTSVSLSLSFSPLVFISSSSSSITTSRFHSSRFSLFFSLRSASRFLSVGRRHHRYHHRYLHHLHPPFDERYCRNNESGFVLWSPL